MIGIDLQSRGGAALQVMECALLAKKKSYSSRSYILSLNSGLLPYYNGEEFKQDNAPIHTANLVKA